MFIVEIAPDIDPALALRDSDLRALFQPRTLEAGRVYEQRGRVRDLRIAEGGGHISAATQGSAPDPYEQRIRVVHSRRGGLSIVGICTCPVHRLCKHLAAVLIAAHRRQLLMDDALPPSSSGAARRDRHPVASAKERALPTNITGWLDGLGSSEDADTEAYPPGMRHRILYVLGPEAVRNGAPRLKIQPMSAILRKDGGWGSARQYSPNQVQYAARFLRPSDRLILTRLGRRTGGIVPPDDDPADLLRRILGTGRAHWETITGPLLTEGPARHGRIAWTLLPDGSQQAALEAEDGLTAFRTPDPWYCDPSSGTMGELTTDLPRSVTDRLLSAPPISADDAPRVREELVRRLPNLPVVVPNELPAAERITAPLRPHLRLINGTLPMDPAHGNGSGRPVGSGLFAVPLARLSWQYGPVTVPSTSGPQARITVLNGALYEPVRDRHGEVETLDHLRRLGFGRVAQLVPVYYQHAHTEDFALQEGYGRVSWLHLVTHEIPQLRRLGWTIEFDDAFPLVTIEPDTEIAAELIESSGIDWLELHLGVMVDGQRIDLIPALIRLITRPDSATLLEGSDDAPLALPLPDGRLLSLPLSRIRPTVQTLLELLASGAIDADSGRIGFSRTGAADLALLEERAGLVWRGGEALRALGRQLREAGGAIEAAAAPEAFGATLRPYQAQGVGWLQFLGAAGLGGVLADDMGLGKTVQTLAHLLIDKAAGRLDRPALIVCPTSLIPNWMMEAARFAPTLRVLTLHGPARHSRFPEIPAHDLVLTTYPLLTRDHEILTQQDWHVVVLDEAQMIKNPNAATTRQALRLQARQRLCLSGTPLQNHLGELWSLFDFLAPGLLGSHQSFRTRFRLPIEKRGDAERQALLTRRVRPFLLRRTKEEVVTELPPKTEITEAVEMEPAQRSVYEAIRLAMHARVKAAIEEKGLARSGIIILDALLKMRQACCDPRLLKLRATERAKAGSAKLDRLMEMLAIMLAEGRRVLLFSQFTEMLALIERRLTEQDVKYVMLTGSTRDRATPVRQFQSGAVPLFLVSLKAGGVGLNLTAADTVIHYDPWWNPAVEDQATDRAHRIGQNKKVFVHRLVTLRSIEEKMETLKEKKRSLVASVLEAERGGALRLTEADVEALFGTTA
ncbi:MAG TPA: DEAD/DEAH box helicase [Acetobacteraceae bacterium]|nr:DEAD/DEAH box helicase [Acetobacteraceae bacterium]